MQFHLRDGQILLYGNNERTGVFDVARRSLRALSRDDAHIIEQALLGEGLGAPSSEIRALLEEGILCEGLGGVDAEVRQALEELEAGFVNRDALSDRALDAYACVLDAHAMRKVLQGRMGQAPVLPETALRRALLVGDAAEVGCKRVACLGDDDLVSVPLAAMGHDVTVFDIDRILFRMIADCNSRCGFDHAIGVQEQDLRDPMARHELGTYDIFMTDPMSNRACFELFLSRACALLKPVGVGFVAVFGPSSALFRQVIDRMQLPVRRWLRDHNRYVLLDVAINRYLSDWVELGYNPHMHLPVAPSAFCAPQGLYDEEFPGRELSLHLCLERMAVPRLARRDVLHAILDALEERHVLTLLERSTCEQGDWTVIHCPIVGGHLVIHVDRDKGRLELVMSPTEHHIMDELVRVIGTAFKPLAQQATRERFGSVYDIRLR